MVVVALGPETDPLHSLGEFGLGQDDSRLGRAKNVSVGPAVELRVDKLVEENHSSRSRGASAGGMGGSSWMIGLVA